MLEEFFSHPTICLVRIWPVNSGFKGLVGEMGRATRMWGNLAYPFHPRLDHDSVWVARPQSRPFCAGYRRCILALAHARCPVRSRCDHPRLPIFRRVRHVPNCLVCDHGAIRILCPIDNGYVLRFLYAGVRHKERDAAEEELLRQSEQPSSKESAPIVSSTSLDSAWRGTTDVAVETTLRNRAIATGV